MQAGVEEGGEAAETFVREVGIVDNNFALCQDWTAIEFLLYFSCFQVIVQAPAAGMADLVQRGRLKSNTSYMHLILPE